jgi:transcriptional regulator EpsA
MDAAAPPGELYGSTLLSANQVLALLRVAETALSLRHRAQFFVWSQGSLQLLLPHQLALCGAYKRSCGELRYELFNNVPLPSGLPAELLDLGALQARWLAAQCQPLLLNTEPGGLLARAGYGQLLLHGVSRPQRPSEIESFFVLAHAGQVYGEPQRLLLALLMPQLHSAWLRVQGGPPVRSEHGEHAAAVGLTERERQVLKGLREGQSNQQIGEALAISALTVKNHVQRILRKLGASNRAHAVARAMSARLLDA